MAQTRRVEFAIVGGGPAGCSAAVMASSLGLQTILIEQNRIGGRLREIPNMVNLAGFSKSGPAIARAMARQLEEAGCAVMCGTAVSVHDSEDGAVEVELGDGTSITAERLVWAAGLHERSIHDEPDISIAAKVERTPEIFLTGPNHHRINRMARPLVVGGDRPIGTFLRDYPEAASRLTVIYFPREAYKISEIARQLPAERTHACAAVSILGIEKENVDVVVTTPNGERSIQGSALITNLGSRPNISPLGAEVLLDESGYPFGQKRCIVFAGDVAHASHQRVAVALGDGARCALDFFYERSRVYRFSESDGSTR